MNHSEPELEPQFAAHLHGVVNAAAETTLVSNRLTFPFTIHRIAVIFPAGCDFLVSATPMLSYDAQASTSGLPEGTPLLLQFAKDHGAVGDDYTVDIPCRIPVATKGTYLKLHLNNSDTQAHHITCTFTITEHKMEAP